MPTTIRKVAVIGAGTMGAGIAYLCAWKGYEVAVLEINDELLKKGLRRIREYTVEGVNRGKMKPKDAETLMNRVKVTTDLTEAGKNADLVIEAVFEDMGVKQDLFRQMDRICPAHTILASNTSALSITEMASVTEKPDRVVGLHFFNPAYTMKLVEMVAGEKTSIETLRTADEFAKSLGKDTITVKDSAGFIVNRVVLPMLNEAAYLVYEGKASMEDVDKAVTLGMNFPMGPFRLGDFVGLDVALDTLQRLTEAFGDKFKPCPLLRDKVKAGQLGMKTRKGFYEY